MTTQAQQLTYSWGSVSVPSTFDPARRPIYIHPIAAMSRKNEDYAQPLVAEAVVKVADKHPDAKILVHTVSYKLTAYLLKALDREGQSLRTISYHSAAEKQRAIDRYLFSDNGLFLAPSLDRGIDLPDDDCRVIVVCKVPFPNLGDKQVSARLHSKGGNQWYAVRTIRSLVQMTGRGMRHESDRCESYILDKQFVDQVWHRNRNLLPRWWAQALVWTRGIL